MTYDKATFAKVVAMGLLVAVVWLMPGAMAAETSEIVHERIVLDFAGVPSEGALTYRSGGEGPLPFVLLIPGSGIADMDHTVVSPYEFGPQGPVALSAIFRDIAERLALEGFAVMRYNKRFVAGPNAADYEKFYQLSLHDFLADAEAALEAAKEHPLVDPDRIYIYGWSEGSTLAAALAAGRSDIKGLILQTPVVFPWRETFVYQTLAVGWNYILRFAEDGYITLSAIERAMQGNGGMVAKSGLSFLVDPAAMWTRQLAINRALDADGDGRIKLGAELSMTTLLDLVDSAFAPGGYLHMYSAEMALPTLGDQVGALHVPILILQGERDANVPPEGASILATSLALAGNADVTLKMYPALGHSLGETETREQDNFQPIAEEPLSDVAAWLKERAGGGGNGGES